jgi:hypothetical protein
LFNCIASLSRSFAGKKVSRSKAPSLSNGGFLHGLDQRRHVERGALAPRAFDQVREQDVFARTDGIRLDTQQAQQAGDHRGDAIAQRA